MDNGYEVESKDEWSEFDDKYSEDSRIAQQTEISNKESISSGIKKMLLLPATDDKLDADEYKIKKNEQYLSIYEVARNKDMTVEDFVHQYPKRALKIAESNLAYWQNILTNAAMTGGIKMLEADGTEQNYDITKNQEKLIEVKINQAQVQYAEVKEHLLTLYKDTEQRKDLLVKSMYQRALKGNTKLAMYLIDRVDGRPAETKEAEYDYDNAYNIYAIIKTLFDKQLEVLNSGNGVKLVCCSRRAGKCWAPETLLRKYDGTLIRADEVKVGDIMMGSHSEPQRVLSTTVGEDMMYRVRCNKKGGRIDFKCNSVHVLTVKFNGDLSKTRSLYRNKYKKGQIYDIALNDFIKLPKGVAEKFVLWRQRTEYEEVKHIIPPYMLGLWLADGDKTQFSITKGSDNYAILNAINEFADEYGYGISTYKDKRRNAIRVRVLSKQGRTCILKDELKRLNVHCNKHIPTEYLIDSVENRLQLLAGLIDGDGTKGHGNGVIYNTCSKDIANGVLELCDSLGFRTSFNVKSKKFYSEASKCYKDITVYETYIKGALADIPLRDKNKACENSLQDTGYRFTIEPVGVGKYAGFTLDGDGRLLLSDYTVTHNTHLLVAMLLIECLRKPRTSVMYIGETMELSEQLVNKAAQDIIETCHLKNKRGMRFDWKHMDNGSNIIIRGLSNTKDPDQIRGKAAKVIVIDEFFHLKSELLEYMQREVLEPMQMDYADDYMFVCAGTPPRVKGSYGEKVWKTWDVPHFSWTWRDNPHPVSVAEREKFVNKVLADKNLTWDSSFARREYNGEWAYDDDLLLYPEYHSYDKHGVLPNIIPTRILFGIDYGVGDNDTIWGCVWNDDEKRGYQFWEDKFNRLDIMDRSISQLEYLGEQVSYAWRIALDYFPNLSPKEANKHILWDADDSDQHLTDYFNINLRLQGEDYKDLRINITNAHKTDKVIMYDKIRDTLRKGDMLIIEGGKCEQEIKSTILKRGPNGEVYTEVDDKAYHPDLLPAMRYALWNAIGI